MLLISSHSVVTTLKNVSLSTDPLCCGSALTLCEYSDQALGNWIRWKCNPKTLRLGRIPEAIGAFCTWRWASSILGLRLPPVQHPVSTFGRISLVSKPDNSDINWTALLMGWVIWQLLFHLFFGSLHPWWQTTVIDQRSLQDTSTISTQAHLINVAKGDWSWRDLRLFCARHLCPRSLVFSHIRRCRIGVVRLKEDQAKATPFRVAHSCLLSFAISLLPSVGVVWYERLMRLRISL